MPIRETRFESSREAYIHFDSVSSAQSAFLRCLSGIGLPENVAHEYSRFQAAPAYVRSTGSFWSHAPKPPGLQQGSSDLCVYCCKKCEYQLPQNVSEESIILKEVSEIDRGRIEKIPLLYLPEFGVLSQNDSRRIGVEQEIVDYPQVWEVLGSLSEIEIHRFVGDVLAYVTATAAAPVLFELELACPQCGCSKSYKMLEAFFSEVEEISSIEEEVVQDYLPGLFRNDSMLSLSDFFKYSITELLKRTREVSHPYFKALVDFFCLVEASTQVSPTLLSSLSELNSENKMLFSLGLDLKGTCTYVLPPVLEKCTKSSLKKFWSHFLSSRVGSLRIDEFVVGVVPNLGALRNSSSMQASKILSPLASPRRNVSRLSSIASTTGVLNKLVEIFSNHELSKVRGLSKSQLRYSHEYARCRDCGGYGYLASTQSCTSCGGQRYGKELSDITWSGRSLGELMKDDIESAFCLFGKLIPELAILRGCGLGAYPLGFPVTFLSRYEQALLKFVSMLQKSQVEDVFMEYFMLSDTKNLSAIFDFVEDSHQSAITFSL